MTLIVVAECWNLICYTQARAKLCWIILQAWRNQCVSTSDSESKPCFQKQSLHRRPWVEVNQRVSTSVRCFWEQSLQRGQRVTLVVVLRKQPWRAWRRGPGGNGDDFIQQLTSAWRRILWKGNDVTLYNVLHLTWGLHLHRTLCIPQVVHLFGRNDVP